MTKTPGLRRLLIVGLLFAIAANITVITIAWWPTIPGNVFAIAVCIFAIVIVWRRWE